MYFHLFVAFCTKKKCVYLNYTLNNMQNCLLEVFQCAIHQSTPFTVLCTRAIHHIPIKLANTPDFQRQGRKESYYCIFTFPLSLSFCHCRYITAATFTKVSHSRRHHFIWTYTHAIFGCRHYKKVVKFLYSFV